MSIETIRSATSSSHTAVSKVEVLDSNGQVLATLPVHEGSVTLDVNNSFLSSCSVTFADPDLAYEAFTRPGAYEIKVYRGVKTSTSTDYVALGVFGISTDTLVATTSLVTATGYDRSRKISRAKLTAPHVITTGTNYATAIRTLLTSRVSSTVYNFIPVTTTTPLLVFSPKDDPWARAQEMAASIGCELFFDRDGICTLRLIPDPSTTPVAATYIEDETATLLDISRSRSDEEAFSHIIVVGASVGSTAPVLAHAYDVDPFSATYIGGENKNFALNKTVTASGPQTVNRPLTRVNDGVKNDADLYTDVTTGTEAWVQIDLGQVQPINAVRVYHYFLDGRTYNSPRTETSIDGVNWTIVSSPAPYAEASSGQLRTFAARDARYVRDYISGSSANVGNHWVEVEVFYTDSVVGDVPFFLESGYILTLAQAQAQADAELRRRAGILEVMELSLVVDPTLTVGDVIAIKSPSAKVDTTTRYVIESLTIPLSPSSSLEATMRKRRT